MIRYFVNSIFLLYGSQTGKYKEEVFEGTVGGAHREKKRVGCCCNSFAYQKENVDDEKQPSLVVSSSPAVVKH